MIKNSNNNLQYFGNENFYNGIDIKFTNINYSVFEYDVLRLKYGWKKLLHNNNGEFKSGQLSVIMGPSGAGKTTLLNVLAGFKLRHSEGEVKLNGTVRHDRGNSNKLIAYIPQHEQLRKSLTVYETMLLAANLKLGFGIGYQEKNDKIDNILTRLGLEATKEVKVYHLSGGQKKRLSIATELLHDPPILFLDEPTTGLDSSSCSQCIKLLQQLAKEGRNVICTIHQPSALIFEKFDKLYVLAEGHCIYNGTIDMLLPHFARLGLECPPYHNPADFLIEIASHEYNCDMDLLQNSAIIENEIILPNGINTRTKPKQILMQSNPPNAFLQFLLLTKRNFQMTCREYHFVLTKFLAHILTATLFGFMYHNVGNSALNVLGNGCYAYGSILLLTYTSQMSVMLKFPLEMQSLNIEHFNGWYKLFPYCCSILAVEVPFQYICIMVYLIISYALTGQPIEFERIYWVIMVAILMMLCAQAWGYFLGATMPIKLAVFFGPVMICAISAFGFCMSYEQTPYLIRWIYDVSYFRAGFHSIAEAVLGLGRKNLYCPEDAVYCHYVDPKEFLEDMGIVNVSFLNNLSIVSGMTGAVYLLTYFSLWFKLHIR